MSKPLHLLVIKTSSMGDILHTLPALSDAAKAITTLKIDWVVEEGFSEIPSWHPQVNNVIPVALRRWRKSWWQPHTIAEYRQFITKIQQQPYDCVIDAQGLLKSAYFVARHSQGERHGYDRRSIREPLASLFYHQHHFVKKQQHAVERTRQLFAQALGYAVPQQQGEYQIAQHFKQPAASNSPPYWVFLHATTRANKHWPESHWRSLIQQVAEHGIKIKLPWGTELEQARAKRLAEGMPHVTVLPKSSLSEIAQLLCGAQGVISVDTGLSHLAAALDKPNLTLYGPTQPELIGGYGKQQYHLSDTEQQMCHILPETVLEKMQSIMQISQSSLTI